MIFFSQTTKGSKNSLLKCLEKYQYGDMGNARTFNQQSLVSTFDYQNSIKFSFHSKSLEDLFLPSEDSTCNSKENDGSGHYGGHGFNMEFVPNDNIPWHQRIRVQPYRNRLQNISDEEVIIPLGHLSIDMFDGLNAVLRNNIDNSNIKHSNENFTLTVPWKFKRGLCHSYVISKSGQYFPLVDNMIVEYGIPVHLREQYATAKQLFGRNGQIVRLREYGADNFKIEYQQLLSKIQLVPPGYVLKCFEVKDLSSDEELTIAVKYINLCKSVMVHLKIIVGRN